MAGKILVRVICENHIIKSSAFLTSLLAYEYIKEIKEIPTLKDYFDGGIYEIEIFEEMKFSTLEQIVNSYGKI